MAKTVLRTLPDGSEAMVKDQFRESEDGPVITRMEVVPYGNIPFFVAMALFLAAGGVFVATARRSKDPLSPSVGAAAVPTEPNDLTRLGVKLMIGGLVSVAVLFGVIGLGVRNSATLSLHSNPYLMTLLTMTCFVAIVFLTIHWRYDAFMRALPPAERLDELSYKNILFAFPFQTLLLITGAVWAYFAWGRSWGWDPKETWAFITWVAFLIYLHGRMLMNWKSNTLSALALVGFMILVFAFLGVNLVLSGLHSYGSV
jgi:cytochrome c-type biogenesis protein CcsB